MVEAVARLRAENVAVAVDGAQPRRPVDGAPNERVVASSACAVARLEVLGVAAVNDLAQALF
jgi:hypothetical protein